MLTPGAEELFDEPTEDIDYEERDKAMDEWAAEETPDAWWQRHLDSSHDAERLNSIVEALVKQRCRRGDLSRRYGRSRSVTGTTADATTAW